MITIRCCRHNECVEGKGKSLFEITQCLSRCENLEEFCEILTLTYDTVYKRLYQASVENVSEMLGVLIFLVGWRLGKRTEGQYRARLWQPRVEGSLAAPMNGRSQREVFVESFQGSSRASSDQLWQCSNE